MARSPAVTRLKAEVDYRADGKQVGYLRLPWSSNVSAYGWIGLPVSVIRNGAGPTLLLMAGNHGDEYEGQVVLAELIRTLHPKEIHGRLIVLPMANFPAAQAGARVSPLDGGNLNRSFPGDPSGTPTQMIAHYIEHVLLPMCDAVLDVHSGGRTLHYVPSALAALDADRKTWPQRIAALRAFGAPVGYIVHARGEDRTLTAAARRQNVLAIGTEMGGSGTLTPTTLSIARRGVENMLAHFGVLKRKPARPAATRESRIMFVGDDSYYLYAPDAGVFEPAFELGDDVKAGQQAGRVVFVDQPLREPVTLHWPRAGTVICRRAPAPCARGDCLGHLATDWIDDEVRHGGTRPRTARRPRAAKRRGATRS
jgi:predicted deacylase